jgi:hypothetical protein
MTHDVGNPHATIFAAETTRNTGRKAFEENKNKMLKQKRRERKKRRDSKANRYRPERAFASSWKNTSGIHLLIMKVT